MKRLVDARGGVRLMLLGLLAVLGAGLGATAVANALPTAPSPGVVAGGFCTFGKGYYSNSTQAAQRIDAYELGSGVGWDTFFYDWEPTGTNVMVGHGKTAVSVDAGTAALQQAIGSGGRPGALSRSATNSTDMGTAGNLGSQTLAHQINLDLNSTFVMGQTGLDGLSLVDMAGVELAGVKLTSAQANALNGQTSVQVLIAGNVAIGEGELKYGLSFAQLTDLISLLSGAFDGCGGASGFAAAHLYQPYVTSSAFAGKRPSTTATNWAVKPTYNTFSGEVVNVGRGCPAGSIDGTNPEADDPYLGDPSGKIALIARGGCSFYSKAARAESAGASAAIIYNRTNDDGSPCTAAPTPGSTGCDALLTMNFGGGDVGIPIAFVQRSTGLALRDGQAPVTAFVQQ